MQQKDWQVRISAGANDCTQLCGGGEDRTAAEHENSSAKTFCLVLSASVLGLRV